MHACRSTLEDPTESPIFAGVKREPLADALQTVDNTLSLLGDDPNSEKLIEDLASLGEEFFNEQVAGAVYACLIGREMGKVGSYIQTRIALGGLLKDVGRVGLSPAEFETHPHRSRDMLAKISWMPEDAIQIAAHQHENEMGTGFPYRLDASRVHPKAKIVRVADELVAGFKQTGKLDVARLATPDNDPSAVKALTSVFSG